MAKTTDFGEVKIHSLKKQNESDLISQEDCRVQSDVAGIVKTQSVDSNDCFVNE